AASVMSSTVTLGKPCSAKSLRAQRNSRIRVSAARRSRRPIALKWGRFSEVKASIRAANSACFEVPAINDYCSLSTDSHFILCQRSVKSFLGRNTEQIPLVWRVHAQGRFAAKVQARNSRGLNFRLCYGLVT